MRVISSCLIPDTGQSGSGLERVQDLGDLDCDVVLTIGTFDGVHRGHQRLLAHLVRCAQETRRLSLVLTFCPHPRLFLHPETQPAYLTTPEEKATLIESFGIDLLLLLPFTRQLADMPAEAFVGELYNRLRLRELWVGAGFALGRGRAGDTGRLQAHASKLGYVLRIIAPVCHGGQVLSSTRIRRLLSRGRVDAAARLLGRRYALSGKVVPGVQRGRCLGIRTANLRLETEKAIPANGVYAVWVLLDGDAHQGVANVGVRPSFGGGERLLEVHLLDHEDDLYGKDLVVEFVQGLRPELCFADVPALVRQIRRDIDDARSVLAGKKVREIGAAVAQHR